MWGEPLTGPFLVLLAIAWIAVLVPAFLRARRSAPLTTTQRFKKGMEVLAAPPPSTAGRWVMVPSNGTPRQSRSAGRVRKQRAILFHLLLLGVGGTLAAALWLQGAWWEIHVATDLTFALYTAGLLETQRRRAERRAKVRSLAGRRATRRQGAGDEPRAYGSS